MILNNRKYAILLGEYKGVGAKPGANAMSMLDLGNPEIGFNLLLSLFAAAILGGTGSLGGAVVGGFLVGLAENLSLLVISPGYKGAMPFLLLLAILLLRPQGIFGGRD